MTQERLFYTDALAAAWMLRHHGMMFTVGKLSGDVIHARCENSAMVISHLAIFPLFKAYIHPDSLPLLQPRVGDAVEFDRWFFERQRDPEYKDYPYQAHYGRVTPFGRNDRHLGITSAGVCWDDTSRDLKFTLPFKIIQRDGTPFMWPESEAA